MNHRRRVWLWFVVLAAGCGGGADLGEECEAPGDEGECVEEAICDKREDGAVLCLKRCSDHPDCATDESCNGVTGSSIKACHPKDEKK